MHPYLVSLAFGGGVGVACGPCGLRSPAPPLVALAGLLGLAGGEALVAYVRARF